VSDVATTSIVHGAVVLHPLFALIVVGLKVIFCSVSDCCEVTVAVIVNRSNMKVAIGTLLTQAPVLSWVATVVELTDVVVAPGVEQFGVQI
jgi:hypothetical protein